MPPSITPGARPPGSSGFVPSLPQMLLLACSSLEYFGATVVGNTALPGPVRQARAQTQFEAAAGNETLQANARAQKRSYADS